MANKHTQEPWIIQEDDHLGVYIKTPDNNGAIARVYIDNPLINKEQGLANAKLIASAPDLLKYATLVMDMLKEYGPSIVPHLMDNDDNAGEELRQAIEKATK